MLPTAIRRDIESAGDDPANLSTWRARLLAGMLWVMTLFGWIVGLPSIALAVHEKLPGMVAADVVALVWLTWLFRRKSLPTRLRAWHVLGLVYLLGVALLINVGHAAQIYLMAVPILGVLLISLPAALWALALNGVTLMVIGYHYGADPGFALAGPIPLVRWAAISANFLLVNGALTVSCAILLRGLETALAEQQTHLRQLAHQATHDALTGLANRALLADRVAQAIAHAERDGHLLGIAVIDLDHFKNVNDSLGHGPGDELVIAASQRLADAVRGEDTVARLGGDEFVVVLPSAKEEDEIAAAVARVHAAAIGMYSVSGHELHITCSCGAAVFPRDGKDLATLLKNADTAMYRAKEAGRNRLQFYRADMNARLAERLRFETGLRHALARDEIRLHFQPQFDVRSGALCGFEGLMRWRPAGGEWVSPAQFIPVAEDSGLIVPLGAWALREACAQAGRWAGRLPGLAVSINISARQFRHKDLFEQIGDALAAHPLPEGTLEIEITESVVMHDIDAVSTRLAELRSRGVRIALDDFGTGFSSLSYLRHLPLDVLKIDQSFVRGLGADARDEAIVRTIVDLAHNLGLTTIAEGVETPRQLALLRQLGVTQAQGYLLGRPQPADDCGSFFDRPPAAFAETAGAVSPPL